MRLAVILLVVGCKNDTALGLLNGHDEFWQAESNEVDILWIIDNSVSMANEQESVAIGSTQFAARLESSGLDFQLGVTSTDVSEENPLAGALHGNPPVLTADVADYVEQFRARVRMGTEGDDQEKGLAAAVSVVTPPLSLARNEGFVRDTALLSIIILSDEDDCSDGGALAEYTTGSDCYERYDELAPVAGFVATLQEVKQGGKVVVSGIVGPDQLDNCDDTLPGKRYDTAIDMTGGARSDICESDYTTIMDSIGNVATGILTKFALSDPAIEDSIVVTVTPDGGAAAEVPLDAAEGYTYVEEYAQIEFHGTAIPTRRSFIEVDYQVASGVEVADTDAR